MTFYEFFAVDHGLEKWNGEFKRFVWYRNPTHSTQKMENISEMDSKHTNSE